MNIGGVGGGGKRRGRKCTAPGFASGAPLYCEARAEGRSLVAQILIVMIAAIAVTIFAERRNIQPPLL